MVASSQLTWPRDTPVGHHDSACQWLLVVAQEFLGRYQLVSTYLPRCGRVVATVVSELALGLEERQI